MMGAQMAGRLRAAGHDLRVWNRTARKTEVWAREGGTACSSPAEAARGAHHLHLMLADDAAVEDVLFGPQGATQTLPAGATVVDHSTVSVAGTRERSHRLAQAGWRYVHGPVLAGPPQIGRGEGLMIVGAAADTYASARPILEAILSRHFVVGEQPHEAAAFKLMANSMLVAIVEGLAEYLAIAKAAGIEPTRAMQLFERFDPCGTIGRRGPRMAAGNYEPTFTLAMGYKDVRLMLEAAGDPDAVPALRAVADKMQSLIADGFGALDLGALGVPVVAPAASRDGRP
jgi:3-hydroxyisobutyrate dehydrogenase